MSPEDFSKTQLQEQTPSSATPSSVTGPMQFPPEWPAFQGFYSSPIPPANPYMWGAQPIMPFGPPPFTSVYPHGGMYAHPSMSAGSHPYSPYGLAAGGNMRDGQGALVPDAEGNEKNPSKTSNGSSGNLARPNGKQDDVKRLEPPASINGYGSNSADSGSEGTSEGSEEPYPPDRLCTTSNLFLSPNRGSHDVNPLPRSMSIGGTRSVRAEANTNFNNGMNHWNGGTSLLHAGGQGGSATLATALASSTNMRGHAQDRVLGELCLQDEREVKRQRRKQSNRESARRSRLRKQTECEEHATRLDALSLENTSLRVKLNQVTEEYQKLSKENRSLLERLQLSKPEDVHGSVEKNIKFSCQEILEDNKKEDKTIL